MMRSPCLEALEHDTRLMREVMQVRSRERDAKLRAHIDERIASAR